VELATVIEQALHERQGELRAQRASIRSALAPVDVLLDPPVAVSLINTLIEWTLTFSKDVELKLESPVWPAPARLLVRIATPTPRAPASAAIGGPPAGTWGTRERGRRLDDGLHWILLRQIAASANLAVTRSGGGGTALLTIEFPQTFMSADGVSSVELFPTDADAPDGLLSGWVLILVRDPVLRAQAAEALRLAGVHARSVVDVSEARTLLADSQPRALVVGQDGRDDEFTALRQHHLQANAWCPVVEITTESPSFQGGGFEGHGTAQVGRDDLHKELAPAILFELAKLA
jgi:hypothetical protein